MQEVTLVVRHAVGLHARPAALFVQTAKRFKSAVTVGKDNMEVNAKSIFGIMMLVAEPGSSLVLTVSGEDAEEAFRAVTDLFERRFDEDLQENM